MGDCCVYYHWYGNQCVLFEQAIFDSIIERMKQLDEERDVEYEMPEGTIDQMAEKYASYRKQMQGSFKFSIFTKPNIFREILIKTMHLHLI